MLTNILTNRTGELVDEYSPWFLFEGGFPVFSKNFLKNHSVARKGDPLNKLSLKGLCSHFTSPPPTLLSVTQPNPSPNPNPHCKRLSQNPVLGCFWE